MVKKELFSSGMCQKNNKCNHPNGEIVKTQQTYHYDNGISGFSAAPHEIGLSAQRLARISATTQQFIDDGQLAGAVTVVARRGKVAHFKAYGMMDIAANKPMQKDTIFRIYSMTKPIAAAAVMMLREESTGLLISISSSAKMQRTMEGKL